MPSKKKSSGSRKKPNADAQPLNGNAHEHIWRRVNSRLLRTKLALPLFDSMQKDESAEGKFQVATRVVCDESADETAVPVIIDVNLNYPSGRVGARKRVCEMIEALVKERGKDPRRYGIRRAKTMMSNQYVFARLAPSELLELLAHDETGDPQATPPAAHDAIWRVWPDFEVSAHIFKSGSTVKADAALRSFATTGQGIVWAVLDSGIDGSHPHFAKHQNLVVQKPLAHLDFTRMDELDLGELDLEASLDYGVLLEKLRGQGPETALQDEFDHGTHVAGIIAGEIRAGEISAAKGEMELIATHKELRSHGRDGAEVEAVTTPLKAVSGMAPQTKLVSFKVLNQQGRGEVSDVIAALGVIQEINGHGRWWRIHGVNLSVGYPFDPEWFACGQSPLCVEVNRLVKAGVVVVAAAGNTGYGFLQTQVQGNASAGLNLTINDPGNAELAITVGATHRDMPHIYGVSYFSSKGPTGDGRHKPDLVAPGERIISCESSQRDDAPRRKAKTAHYVEKSGTSMAAPHVSGVIAAFLSTRREFIGRPEEIKQIFLQTATDLNREVYFQGRGLVDLMRAIQSV
jgi:subtilisin family serine protease